MTTINLNKDPDLKKMLIIVGATIAIYAIFMFVVVTIFKNL